MGFIHSLFSFRGRLNRRAYFAFSLILALPGLAVTYLVYRRIPGLILEPQPLPAPDSYGWTVHLGNGFLTLAYLLLLWPVLALMVKRIHDRGRSGWFLLIGLIPLINLWLVVELNLLRGTAGENRFGPDPLEGRPRETWKSWLVLLAYVIVLGLQAHFFAGIMADLQIRMQEMGVPGSGRHEI